MNRHPRLIVFSSLVPHAGQPAAGLFIRERMFRVAGKLPVTVVAPVPWFPLQGLIRRFRPHFRPPAPRHEQQDGIDVYHPRFFCVPGLLKSLDGFFMALGSRRLLTRLQRERGFDLIDAHFAYPDGAAAAGLAQRFGVPCTITLRGTEPRLSAYRWRRRSIVRALQRAARVFAVAGSLKQLVTGLGIDPAHVEVIGNGVDTARFHPVDRDSARQALGLPAAVPVLVSVGGLCERKGFHRVLEQLPALRREFPALQYLIVGGPSAEGDWRGRLQEQIAALQLGECVHLLGVLPPDDLMGPLSAADVFVLATRNEGWANVFLEAMACGLPVITTDVGGNAEVVGEARLGTVVPFGDGDSLRLALAAALRQHWDRDHISAYAAANSWDQRVTRLVEVFRDLTGEARA